MEMALLFRTEHGNLFSGVLKINATVFIIQGYLPDARALSCKWREMTNFKERGFAILQADDTCCACSVGGFGCGFWRMFSFHRHITI